MRTSLADVTGAAHVVAVGGSTAVRRRLAEMGVRPGAHIRVLYRTSGGGHVLAVGGARVAVDSVLSRAIEAEPGDD